jgi:hypothetical protein
MSDRLRKVYWVIVGVFAALTAGLWVFAGTLLIPGIWPLGAGFGLWQDTAARKKVAMARAPAFLP